MAEQIRVPRQNRSIDKKNRIIEAGYELFQEKGFFETNTKEIALRAKVSTGIVYGYFHDKKDILIDVLNIYINKVYNPVKNLLKYITPPIDFNMLIEQTIKTVLDLHKKHSKIHEALYALSSLDPQVNSKFLELEETITNLFYDHFIVHDYNPLNLREKIHLAMEIIQSFAHETVFDNHSYINYESMGMIIHQSLLNIFEK